MTDKLTKIPPSRLRSCVWRRTLAAIRRLCRERQNVEGKMERRDWVNDYASYGSETYAPFTRHGVFLDHGADQNIVRSRYLTTYEGQSRHLSHIII